MDTTHGEQQLAGRAVVEFAKGKAIEIKRMRDACLREEIPAAVGPCPGSG